MTRNVQVVRPDESLQRAAQVMDELNVGALPVCDKSGLVGMITDRDITVRATAAGLPANTRVADVMTDHARWCTGEQTVQEAMQQMSDVQIRRMPVVDAENRVVGIVSLGDLAMRHQGHVAAALRRISDPSMPDRPSN
ncbi:CBS domain-containing protein [Scleromatobacter humisilvae]|uniref:CBS domain-containing protein n=1 Tax=Scleromatobacter humisilvae TaxID=2897159 RepID=A0A9X1YJV0_9BURK|nr:CBS domain-containing protein [Scleromatobacter humisilvae]MCK9686143.1 CBS domain-containing protein [Scleromatobacter humisilvae]